MKSGVPFHLIFDGLDSLMRHERLAMQIVISELESGTRYNWRTGEYEEVK
ncbi:TPA: hypothetical protein ACQ431_003011 [Citrobacter murliniae]